MPYWQLFYHLVLSTKNREPLLSPMAETEVYGYFTSKAVGLEGVVYAAGGTEDHVNMVVATPPSISVSSFVGQVKGVASARFNQSGMGLVRLAWQDAYGAFSFDGKRLPPVIAHVQRQKEHHADSATIPILERMASETVGPHRVGEANPRHAAETDAWRAEMLAL